MEKEISKILNSIDDGEYQIPEFQRGYVWNSTQVKEFFRSLYKGYPTGSFLIWKTKNPSKIRGEKKDTNSNHHLLILDGQQRLTTIYTIFRNKTPDWYEGVSLRTDLYFNLESEEFEYYMPRKMKDNKEWINVSGFLSNGGVGQFLKDSKEFEPELREYFFQKIDILNDLSSIQDYRYYIQEITLENLDEVVEIFNLVNKTGTTLSKSDLALAIITSNWPEAKDKFREASEEFKNHNYDFTFGNYTRFVNIFCTDRGLYSDHLAEIEAEEFEKNWKVIKKILYYLINVLRSKAFIDSSDSFSSLYVLYVLAYYLKRNDGKFKDEEDADKAIYWMFTALLWGRFSGSSESYLVRDLNIIKEKNDVFALIEELHLFRGSSLDLRPEDLALQGVRSRIYNLFYCAIRAQDARDWTNPVLHLYSNSLGYNNKLERHHIFPKAFLYKRYNSSNTIHKALINEIGNIALVTQASNISILDKDPAAYLPTIPAEQRRKQFVPTDQVLYKIENFEEFLKVRREKLADGINEFLRSFYKDDDHPNLPSDLKPYDQKIENIELVLRDLIADRLQLAEELNAYNEFIPSHIKDKSSHRINSWLSKNPGEDKQQFSNLRRRLDFLDIQEYKDVICAKITYPIFQEIFGNKPGIEMRFNQLAELRNSIRHSRDITETTLKDGEAAISWFESILRPYLDKSKILDSID